jgi:outer membrane protein OmpA-like peptidoglycan-associated protein
MLVPVLLQPLKSRLRRAALAPGVLGVRGLLCLTGLLCLPLAACGPRVFEGASVKVIETSAPPPPIVKARKPEPRVEITDDKIVIREKIQFEHNKARIRSVSDDLLAEIARVINDNPRIKKIRVEGHASADGRHEHNVELSKRRAEAVREHLVRHGKVAAERLESDGYGPDRPIADNETEAGREANRRVEFAIVEQEYTQTRKIIDTQTGSTKVETEKKAETAETVETVETAETAEKAETVEKVE